MHNLLCGCVGGGGGDRGHRRREEDRMGEGGRGGNYYRRRRKVKKKESNETKKQKISASVRVTSRVCLHRRGNYPTFANTQSAGEKRGEKKNCLTLSDRLYLVCRRMQFTKHLQYVMHVQTRTVETWGCLILYHLFNSNRVRTMIPCLPARRSRRSPPLRRSTRR